MLGPPRVDLGDHLVAPATKAGITRASLLGEGSGARAIPAGVPQRSCQQELNFRPFVRPDRRHRERLLEQDQCARRPVQLELGVAEHRHRP